MKGEVILVSKISNRKVLIKINHYSYLQILCKKLEATVSTIYVDLLQNTKKCEENIHRTLFGLHNNVPGTVHVSELKEIYVYNDELAIKHGTRSLNGEARKIWTGVSPIPGQGCERRHWRTTTSVSTVLPYWIQRVASPGARGIGGCQN